MKAPTWRPWLVAIIVAMAFATAWESLVGLFASRPSGGNDYLIFLAASRLTSAGGNPYDAASVLRVAHHLAPWMGLLPPAGGFAYLPWVAVATRPLSLAPFLVGFALWDCISLALIVWSTERWCCWLGGPLLRGWTILLVGLSSASIATLMLGQMDAWLLAGLTLSFGAYRRQWWAVAGVISVATTALKPQAVFLLPVGYMLLVWKTPPARAAYLRGAVAAAIALVGLPLVALPNLWANWWVGAVSFGRSLSSQIDIASLQGLERWAPTSWGWRLAATDPVVMGIAGLGILAALWCYWRVYISPAWLGADAVDRWMTIVAVPMALGLAVSPYLHTYDLLVCVPLLLWGLARHPGQLRSLPTWVVLAGLELSPLALAAMGVLRYSQLRSPTPFALTAFLCLIGSWLHAAKRARTGVSKLVH
ncbi:MAG: glycosyltransferase 87 family protein [Candidatus Dormibacteria bacterium]